MGFGEGILFLLGHIFLTQMHHFLPYRMYEWVYFTPRSFVRDENRRNRITICI